MKCKQAQQVRIHKKNGPQMRAVWKFAYIGFYTKKEIKFVVITGVISGFGIKTNPKIHNAVATRLIKKGFLASSQCVKMKTNCIIEIKQPNPHQILSLKASTRIQIVQTKPISPPRIIRRIPIIQISEKINFKNTIIESTLKMIDFKSNRGCFSNIISGKFDKILCKAYINSLYRTRKQITSHYAEYWRKHQDSR